MAPPYTYQSKDALPTCALTEWTFESNVNCETLVLPDGCQDIIIKDGAESGCNWFISDLSHCAYRVPALPGMRIRGIRLQPGVELRQAVLNSWLEGNDFSALCASDQLNEFCVKSENLTHALACLASDERTVQCVARELGVSLRSLQRLVKASTGQSPYFWFSLARIRRAARSLASFQNLSDAAAESGFADQAHMNRETKKWFGLTPNQVKADSEVRSLLSESGYG